MDTLRQSIHPAPGDTWATIAETHLPGEDSEQAISQLQSWNLHIFARRIAPKPDGSPANQFSLATSYFLSRRSRSLDGAMGRQHRLNPIGAP